MADALRWLFEVQNRISGPAKDAAGDLVKLRARLAGATAATKAFNAAQRRGPALGSARSMAGSPFDRSDLPRSFRMRGDALRDIAGQTRRAGANMGFLRANALAVVGAVVALGQGLRAAGDMIMRIARGAAELTRQFTEGVAQAALFRSRALFGLERILGSPGAAQGFLRQARELSQFLGSDVRETIASMQSLMVRGFGQRESLLFMQAFADLQSISPEPIDTSRIVLAIGQIRSAGRLMGEELNQLQDANLPVAAVREAIARNLGITVEQIPDVMRRGQISADVALRSILEGISATTGTEIGGAAREFSQTVPGMLARLQQAPTRFFDAVAEAVGGLESMRAPLAQIVGLLDPGSKGFQRIVSIAASGFSTIVDVMRTALDVGRALFEGIFGATGQGAARGFEDTLQGIRDALAWLREPETLANIRSFGAGLVALWRASEPLRKVLLAIGVAVGVVVAAITVSLGTIAAAAVAIPTAIIGALSGLVALVEEIIPRAFTWGASIVDGLIAGIRSRLEVLRMAAQSMGSTVVGAVTHTLGIASPSREMRWLGEMTGAGFALGLDASMPNIAVPTPQVGGGALGGGGASIAVTIGDIHVNGENASEVANELRRILPAELQSAFEQIVAQYGMA